jgi:serpin B
MTIILPKSSQSIDALIAGLDVPTWNNWLSTLSPDSVTLTLPKFKAEYEDSLNGVLKQLGMGIAFTAQADFTKMYRPGGLFIGFVKHKTFLQVDEEGTEAAAVTVVGMERTSAGPQRQLRYMYVDRPFLCVIREHQSDAILFIGKITHPAWAE